MEVEIVELTPLAHLAGFLIRRSQQIATAAFSREMERAGLDITPMQFAALRTVNSRPGLDQAELAVLIAYDRATTGAVVDRLVRKGLIRREHSTRDRRVRLLWSEPSAEALLAAADRVVRCVEASILEPLSEGDRRLFLALLARLVAGNRPQGCECAQPSGLT